MKNRLLKAALLVLLFGLVACSDDEKSGGDSEPSYSPSDMAFPQAQGCGAKVTGGRGGAVYVVSTLEDQDAAGNVAVGSLRWALQKTGTRIITFAVSGTIHLTNPLRIPANTTILGQTAPGDGICIAGDVLATKNNHLVEIGGDNVILQFLRFRLANIESDADAFSCIGHNNVMIDHCSFSWSTDECASCYKNRNFTMQWCLVYEGMMKGEEEHGFGGIWGGCDVTFHHNLMANQMNRYPRFDHQYAGGAYYGPLDFVNNVIYIVRSCNGVYGGESCNNTGEYRKINMVNNYYRYHASVSSGNKYRIMQPTTSCSNCTKEYSCPIVPAHFYIAGNYVDGSATNTSDNWKGVNPSTDAMKATTPFAMAIEVTGKQTAEEAFESVLANAGASLSRDAADTKVINNVINNNGTIVSAVPTLPTLISTTVIDSDYDGLPDEWEDAHGLNKDDVTDSRKISSTGYANIENYAQELVSGLY